MEWRSIETAPVDGTEIMVWVVKNSDRTPQGHLLVWFDEHEEEWVNSQGAIRFSLDFTHWMPLPEPPNAT